MFSECYVLLDSYVDYSVIVKLTLDILMPNLINKSINNIAIKINICKPYNRKAHVSKCSIGRCKLTGRDTIYPLSCSVFYAVHLKARSKSDNADCAHGHHTASGWETLTKQTNKQTNRKTKNNAAFYNGLHLRIKGVYFCIFLTYWLQCWIMGF